MAAQGNIAAEGRHGVLAVRAENLALAYQETFTAIVRLRANRQAVSDAESFRRHMRQLIHSAEQTAQSRGYTAEDIRLGTFAVVAFLDESVLNLHNPVFGDWPRKPLQEELFGGHIAGEIFFQSLQRLLGRPDSEETADVIEVFLLSLLLGYRGKYGVGGRAELDNLVRTAREKIRRIRQDTGRLSPAASVAAALERTQRDPWLRRLVFIAGGSLALTVILFVVFRLLLGSGVASLAGLATGGQS
jgi:type VI secretion system protein ImpK